MRFKIVHMIITMFYLSKKFGKFVDLLKTYILPGSYRSVYATPKSIHQNLRQNYSDKKLKIKVSGVPIPEKKKSLILKQLMIFFLPLQCPYFFN